jgi:hypothetical protein
MLPPETHCLTSRSFMAGHNGSSAEPGLASKKDKPAMTPALPYLFHVGIDVLHVVELFEAFHHLVDCLALLVGHFLQVVWHVSEFG